MNVAEDVYSGLAGMGRVFAIIGLIIGIIFGIVLVIMGIIALSAGGDGSGVAAGAMVAIGVVVVVLAWLIYHFTQVSKPFAATEGAIGSVDMLKGLFD